MTTFYTITKKEHLLNWLAGIAIVFLFAYFFYRSAWALLILSPLAYFYQKIAAERLRDKKQDALRGEFKELIEIVAGNLRAGYSVENAFLEAGREKARMQQSHHSPLANMLVFIRRGLDNNIPLDVRLKECGQISKVKEIAEFADVFSVAKHSGGNMIDCIGQFATMIGDKIETEKEINVLVSARRGEQNIMNLVPFGILLYLDISSPGFFSTLYHSLTGIMVMTACLAIYLAAYVLSGKMLRIDI